MKKSINIMVDRDNWNKLRSKAILHNFTLRDEFDKMLKGYVK